MIAFRYDRSCGEPERAADLPISFHLFAEIDFDITSGAGQRRRGEVRFSSFNSTMGRDSFSFLPSAAAADGVNSEQARIMTPPQTQTDSDPSNPAGRRVE